MFFLVTLRAALMTIIAALSRARRPSSGGSAPSVPYLNAITLSGDASVVMTHTTGAYTIAAQTDQNGLPFVGTPGPFTYRSSNPSVATINSTTGVATPVAPGTTNITVQATNSRGTVITSSPANTLTVVAQIATGTIGLSPISATLANPGTRQFTATVFDQATSPNAISGASVSWDTSDHSKATVSGTGLVTAVATTGGTPITLTATSGGASGTASVAVSNASTVTQVIASYNGDPSGQNLFFAGQTYPLAANDQAGNTLAGAGTWASSDGTNAPIDSSSGVVSPNAGMAAVTFTFTHTATGLQGTLTATILKTPPALLNSDAAPNYPTDPDWRNVISANGSQGINVPASTGPGNAKYNIAISPGRITLDSTVLCMGQKTFRCTYQTDNNVPQLQGFLNTASPNTAYPAVHVLWVTRWAPGFNSGVSVPGNNGSYKDGFFLSNAGLSGRTGPDYSNGNGSTANIFIQCNLQVNNSTVGGQAETSVGSTTTEWTSGDWFATYYIYDTPTNNIMRSRSYRWRLGLHPVTDNLFSTTPVQGPMDVGQSVMSMNYLSPFGLNRNIPPTGTLSKNVVFWQAVNGSLYADPWGIQGTQATPTLSGISGGSLAPGDTNKTITLTGTNFNLNTIPVFSNSSILVQSFTVTGGTSMAVIVNVPSNATTGAGTVAISNPVAGVTTSTQVVSVAAPAPPGAPTLSNASAAAFNTLTIPYVQNASGALAASLAWFYRVSGSGSGYTQGSPNVTITSPALGGSGNAQISLPTASTTYDIKMQAVNGGGNSGDSNVVTGTTAAAATLITANLAGDFDADAGTDVSTDGAGVGFWTDQTATAGVLQQGTTGQKPILKLALYNGHNAIRFASTSSQNLTAAAAISAYNSADGTLYVVAKSLADNPASNQRLLANFNGNGGASPEGYLIQKVSGSNQVNLAFGTGSGTAVQLAFTTTASVASGLHCYTAVLDHTTPAETPYFDGIVQTAGTSAYARQATSPNLFSVGSQSGSNNFGDWDVCRVLYYSAIHTPSQVAQNLGFLKTRYGMS